MSSRASLQNFSSESSTDDDSDAGMKRRTPARRKHEQEEEESSESSSLKEEEKSGGGKMEYGDEEAMLGTPAAASTSQWARKWSMRSLGPDEMKAVSSLSPPPEYTNRNSTSHPNPAAPFVLSRVRIIYLVLTFLAVSALIAIAAVLLVQAGASVSSDAHGGGGSSSGHGGGGATTSQVNTTVPEAEGVFARFPELYELLKGNREFVEESEKEDPGLIEELAGGQHPKFAYLGCSDSRVPETSVFDAEPGDLFVMRNVGNQYAIDDLSAETVLSYAIEHLGVQHIIVMGHYGCGAVQGAMTKAVGSSDPYGGGVAAVGTNRIAQWIRPIYNLYQSSTNEDIVNYRHQMDQLKEGESQPALNRSEPAFMALVQENVNRTVQNLALDSTILTAWQNYAEAQQNQTTNTATTTTGSSDQSDSTSQSHRKRRSLEPVELWIHGFVYDVDTGLVEDLGVSVGPPS